MKRKIKSAKGFTLAELLIVVAIIAVLVAIGIPIFTSQLEKSREAVDLSDVRSAYAEVMMAAITGDTTAYYTKDTNQTIYKQPGSTPEGNVYSITVEPLKQKQDNWQTALPITIGGVSSTDNVHWVGNPGANGKCRIVYTPAQGATGDYVTFYWEGGTSGDSGNEETGGDTGEDNNSGGSTDSGNSGNGESSDTIKDMTSNAIPFPERITGSDRFKLTRGNVYSYKGNLYIAYYDHEFSAEYYRTPDNTEYDWLFLTATDKVFTSADSKDGKTVEDVKKGDLYRTADGRLYIYGASKTVDAQETPTYNPYNQNWIEINKAQWKE